MEIPTPGSVRELDPAELAHTSGGVIIAIPAALAFSSTLAATGATFVLVYKEAKAYFQAN